MDELRTESITDQMMAIATAKDLTKTEARELVEDFRTMASIDLDVEEKALAIVVTDETQIDMMARAHEMRIELKDQRIAVEKHRVFKKEYHLRTGQVIDGLAKVLRELIEPLETHLAAQENFVKLQEEKREAARREAADKLLVEQEEKDRVKREEEQRLQVQENARLKTEAAERDQKEADARAEAQKISDDKAKKARADAERSRQAAVQREREASDKIAAEREVAHQQEREDAERAHLKARAEAQEAQEKEKAIYQEEPRKARQVTCPKCGHEFDSADHKSE